MKNILIFSQSLEIGGAERSLIGLLNSIDYFKYNTDLFLMRHEGEFMGMISNNITLLPLNPYYAALGVPITSVLRAGKVSIALARFYGKFKARQFIKRNSINGESAIENEYSHKYTKKFMPRISNKEYDLAISFLSPHYFVAEKVKAKRKFAWIHTDYSFLQVDIESELKMWSAYDRIISISNKVTDGFLSKFPSLKGKIVLIENILSTRFVREQADIKDISSEMPKENGVYNICSVGRFTNAKNFDNVPFICKLIMEQGIRVRWYLIGFGDDEQLIVNKIKESGMEDNVIILGKKINPYPYIKACDIYVQPSRFEGKAVTVTEAQILNKPVVITNYSTAQSQVVDGFDGIIIPLDNEMCAIGIVNFINNKILQKMLIYNCSKTEYGSEKEVEKIYSLME